MDGATVQLTFVGSGDAFGSGGRLQTCLAVTGQAGTVLIDCGASALAGLKRCGIDPDTVTTVLLTHLHGDHFAGIPFLVLDGQFHHRETDLLVVGPPGVHTRVEAAMEVLFPGSSRTERRFALRYRELSPRAPISLEQPTDRGFPATVRGFPVVHASGAPPFALRLDVAGTTIAYSGDTEWTDTLLEAADGADVFVCECYQYDRDVRYHLSYTTLRTQLPRLRCRRLVVTHMSETMLDHLDSLPDDVQAASDGLRLAL